MTTLTVNGFAYGDIVAVNARGANHVANDPTETTERDGNEVVVVVADFLVEGMRGRVVRTRTSGVDTPTFGDIHEVAVTFDDDPVAGRAFWMMHDEIVKEG